MVAPMRLGMAAPGLSRGLDVFTSLYYWFSVEILTAYGRIGIDLLFHFRPPHWVHGVDHRPSRCRWRFIAPVLGDGEKTFT